MSGANVPGIYGGFPDVTPAERALVLARIIRHTPEPDEQRDLAAALGLGGGAEAETPPRHGRRWPSTAKHGTVNGYNNLDCRCEACTDAWRVHSQALRASRTPPPPGDARHGLRSTYVNYGCRCEFCQTGHAKAMSAYSARRRAAQSAEAPS